MAQKLQVLGAPNDNKPLTSMGLHYLAMGCMLLDHMHATVAPTCAWLVYIGRLSFPIFCFLLVEGYCHTKNLPQYMFRLFIFAVISEIPFDLVFSGHVVNPYYQNVMFTLLLGLCAIVALDRVKKEQAIGARFGWGLAAISICLLGSLLATDYGSMGVLMCVVFYLFRDMPFAWLFQLTAMIGLNQIFYDGPGFVVGQMEGLFTIQVQSLAILALVPIWLYNGQRGRACKLAQYGLYAFYPGHLMVLYLLTAMCF